MADSETFKLAFEALQPQIAEWKRQHKKLYLLRSSGLGRAKGVEDIPFVLRHPERAELSRMLREMSKDPVAAVNNTVFELALHPDRATLGRLADEIPAVLIQLYDGLKEQVGFSLDFSAQEL